MTIIDPSKGDDTNIPSHTARALVAHPKFEYRPGMLLADGHRLTRDDCDGLHPETYEEPPVLADDATAGVLVGMLAEAPSIVAFVVNWSTYPKPHWTVEAFRDAGAEASGRGSHLGVAVAEALLAAWEVP